jgi:hypothetical protein
MSPGAENMKKVHDASVPPNTSTGAQNMKTGLDALGTVEKESRSAKHENGTRRPRTAEMIPGAQNMKTGLDALGTA